MKKNLLTIMASLAIFIANAAPGQTLFLKGAVNGWMDNPQYLFTETPSGSGVYVLENSFTLSGDFKIADMAWSGTGTYGTSSSGPVPLETLTTVMSPGSTMTCDGEKYNVTKITLNTNDMTILINGTVEGGGTGTNNANADSPIIYTNYYDITGKKLNAKPAKGFYIEQNIHENGARTSRTMGAF